MEIVDIQRSDIRNALDLVLAIFQEFESPDYSEQGIEEFKKFISYNSIIEKIDRKELRFWGCIDNDNVIGVIATRGVNHICLLFVEKSYHRRGIARCLFQKVIEECKLQSNVQNITVNSSPYAVDAYHRLGFIDTDKEQVVSGIRFTPMSYLLE